MLIKIKAISHQKTGEDNVDQFEIEYNGDEDVDANGAFTNLPDDAKVFIKNMIFDRNLDIKIYICNSYRL